jgi:O-acetyl-ADP-ribose deacetylase (regulator of RNase III)
MNDFALGAVRFVEIEPQKLWVANLIGQHGIHGVPIRYDAVATGLETVTAMARIRGASVHMPRIGCGLAGGTWDRIEPLILGTLVRRGVAVTVYDLE